MLRDKLKSWMIAVVAFSVIVGSVRLLEQTQRLNQALAGIALLKGIVGEQDRKISELERILLPHSRVSNTPVGATTVLSAFAPSDSVPWKTPFAWDKLRTGMSQAQVIAILGKPTSIETTLSFKTLYYRGEFDQLGFVSGDVKLDNDSLWHVDGPVFMR